MLTSQASWLFSHWRLSHLRSDCFLGLNIVQSYRESLWQSEWKRHQASLRASHSGFLTFCAVDSILHLQGLLASVADWRRCPVTRVLHGVAEAWYLTKAMAASSLQNSSNTITPSSSVMWSMMGPSGSKPSSRFLTRRSLGVKS